MVVRVIMQCNGPMVAHNFLLKCAIRLWFICLFSSLWFHLLEANNFVNNCGNHRQVYGPSYTNSTYGIITNYENETFNCEWLIVIGPNGQLSNLRFINLRFISNDLNCHSDTLYIFDGQSYENQLIATLSRQSTYSRLLTASSGYMLMLHYWQVDSIPSHFTAEFSITECPLNCSSHGQCVNNHCKCDQFWTGEACQIESCRGNCSLSGQCVMSPSNQTYFNDYHCECMPDYIGQSCDVIKTDSANPKHWLHWKVLFANEQYFSNRASHSTVYSSITDTIYTYGGRNFETIFGDLLAYSVTNNSWHKLGSSGSHPKPLWGHTLNIFNSSIILFGGIFSNGMLSNSLWIYAIASNEWTMKSADETPIPSLAFHTATIVESEWLYIVGGRFQNGTHSSNLYRTSLFNRKANWQLVNPINGKPFVRQIVGHTAEYYKPLKSIIIFGGVSLVGERTSRLTSDIHLYNVDNRVWSTLQYLEKGKDIHFPSERAFHSMLLLDHYLLVFGGFAQNNGKNITWQTNCQDNRLYMYSLTCHKWIDFDYFMSSLSSAITSSHFPMEGLVSHTLVARKNLLFVLGGYSGQVHNEIYVYSLPKVLANAFQYELCSQLKSRTACDLNRFCFWCPSSQATFNRSMSNYCSHYELKCSTQVLVDSCPGLCPRQSNCYVCLAFNSIDKEWPDEDEVTTAVQSHSCLWNSLDFRCFRSNISNSVHFNHFLSSASECAEHNIETGIVFLKYFYPQNLSNPDQVAFLRHFDLKTSFREGLSRNIMLNDNEMSYSSLKKSDNSSLINIVRILGYIHPFGLQPYRENLLRLYLGSTSAQASFVMNGLTRPMANITSSKQFHRSYVDLPVNFSSNSLIDDNFLVDLIVKFPIRTTWKELEYERIELSATGSTGTEALSNSNLTPYRNVHQCSEAMSCTACLSNLACTWCPASARCSPRTDLNQCEYDPNVQYHLLPLVDADQCVLCSDYFECGQCVQSITCEWLPLDEVCVRRGRFDNSIRHVVSCPSACHLRSSCSSCLDESQKCVWCHSTEQCISSLTYYSSPTFHFCQTFDPQLFYHNGFFLNKRFLSPYRLEHSQIMCGKCLRHSTCSICENDLSCEWCYLQSDSSQGFCAVTNSTNSSQCNLKTNLVNFVDHSESEKLLFVSSNHTCPQVNECRIGNHNCHLDSICIDTEQSFKCLCRAGFTGDGLTCTRTCDSVCVHGYCSEFPDFRCICDLGWTGDDCSFDCGCNNHSTCQTGVGICDHCENNTRGKHCHLCSVGSYGNATNPMGCKVCDCNGHGDELLGICNHANGICYCQDNTEGPHCERCVTGFYGNAHDGGNCFMECQHRAFVSQLDTGFFGSYIRDIHFGKHSSINDKDHQWANSHLDCLWIFTSHSSLNRFHSFDKYYSKLNEEPSPLPLGVTIFKSAQLNCTLSRVLVFDGIPRFLSASNKTQATILANLCGQQAHTDTSLVAISGFATVLYSSDNFSQGFNASFNKLVAPTITLLDSSRYRESTLSTSSISLAQDGNNRHFSGEILWAEQSYMSDDLNSLWPKQGHVQLVVNDVLIFIGGHEHSENLTLSLFNLPSKSWQQASETEGPKPSNRLLYASTLLSQETIFIYGGLSGTSNQVMQDLWSCTVSNNSQGMIFRWKLIDPPNKANIPPLLGHSFTAFSYVSKPAIILVGGYSPSDGFLDKQYIYLPESNQWQVLPTKGASPLGVVGHSSVYHSALHSLYLFGGMDFKDSQKTVLSNTMYVLNMLSLVWHRVQPNNIIDRNFATPRYLHVAASTDDYMIVHGGRTSLTNGKTNNSMFAYRFRCNSWVALNELSFWPQNVSSPFSSQVLSMTVSRNLLYIYQTTPRTTNAATSRSLSVVQMSADLCALHSNSPNTCLAVKGCSFCTQHNNTHHQTYCFDNQQMDSPCAEGQLNSNHTTTNGRKCTAGNLSQACSEYTNCVDCTTSNYESSAHEETCQWCTDCRHKEGRCIVLNDTCESFEVNSTVGQGVMCGNISIDDISQCPLQRCLATDCDKCMKYSQSPTHKLTCVWTRQVYKFIRFGHTINTNPIFDWACIDSTIIETSLQVPNVETVPPLSCPARCFKHKTCSLCLEGATGDESGSHECVWSEMTQECMSPTYELLRCEGSLCGGLIHRKFYSQCVAPCESHTKASDCLTAPNCGWCAVNGFAMDGVGLCMRGGLFGSMDELCHRDNFNFLMLLKQKAFFNTMTNFTTEWNYLYLPKENECLNNHHSCDPISQECFDLDDGFMCRCKPGYKLVESTCKPICHQGCVYGVCVQPNVCKCSFGYIGHDCSLECKCHGHSTCPSADHLHECVECHNNTQGKYCDQCKPFFVGDPRNLGTCQSCLEYCNYHSSMCFSEDVLNASISNSTTDQTFWHVLVTKVTEGPKSGALCIDCQNNTEGERCDRCKLGFFKISDDIRDGCRRCMCNDHGSICNPFNGENCNCQNNTENDRQCNYLNTKEYSNYINKTYFFKSAQIMTTYSLPCWMLQCSKCKDYFYGIPTNGHQCYRHMYIDKEYCFDPVSQDDCINKALLHGRTVFFGIQPRYMNVDIKLVLYMLGGDIDLYFCSKDDLFVVKVNQSNGLHHTFIDHNYIQPQFNTPVPRVKIRSVQGNSSQEEDEHLWLSVDDNSLLSHGHTLKSPFYLREQHLDSVQPHYYTVNSLNEIVIFRNVRHRLEVTIPYRSHDLRTTRFYFMLRGNFLQEPNNSVQSNLGYVLFRQDQCRIDLFVFFSVFFSCFFLFLCISVLAWKVKQFLDNRRAQHMHEIELEHMASRPFASIFLLFDSPQVDIGFRKVGGQSVSVQSTPAKKMSLFRQLAIGFKESPKIHPEGIQSTTKLPEKVPERSIKPLSIEPTSDGLAAILTTLVQLPGGNLVPNRLTAASSLVSLKLAPHLIQQINYVK